MERFAGPEYQPPAHEPDTPGEPRVGYKRTEIPPEDPDEVRARDGIEGSIIGDRGFHGYGMSPIEYGHKNKPAIKRPPRG